MEDYRKTVSNNKQQHDILYILDLYETDIDRARTLMYEMVPFIINYVLNRTRLRMEIEIEDVWSEMFMVADKWATWWTWKDKHPMQRKSYFRTLMWRELRQPSKIWMFITYPLQAGKSHHISHINHQISWWWMWITDFTTWDPQEKRDVDYSKIVRDEKMPDEVADLAMLMERTEILLYELLEPRDLEIYIKYHYSWMKKKEIAQDYESTTVYYVTQSLKNSEKIINENLNPVKESDSEWSEFWV